MDGFGLLHPRRCGSASQLGVLSGFPTVGVGKALLHIDGLSQRDARLQLRDAEQDAFEAAGPQAPSVSQQDEQDVCDSRQVEASDLAAVESSCQRCSVAECRCHLGDSPVACSARDLNVVSDTCKQALCQEKTPAACDSSTDAPLQLLLIGNSGEVLGIALRPRTDIKRPIYVSVGHRISLSTAVAVVQACCRHRVPEPIRQADIRSREHVRGWLEQSSA